MEADKSVYFIGIAGVGMSAVAGYCCALGFRVHGSDEKLYPPVSDIIAKLPLRVFEGFSADNLRTSKPDMVIVGNRISANNPEYQYAKRKQLPIMHFPHFLGTRIAAENKQSLVVTGTHGKTTTTALLAFLLTAMGDDPSYFIGGLPLMTGFSNYHVGKGDYFCLEGDEYDSSLDDKEPKFMHYRPSFLLLNVIEWDHADIYPDLAAMMVKFQRLLTLLQPPAYVIANIDCPNVAKLIANVDHKLITVSPYQQQEADVVVLDYPPRSKSVRLRCRDYGEVEASTDTLLGDYNAANIAMVAATLLAMGKDVRRYLAHVKAFKGVAKRLEHKFSSRGVHCYVDFAHHPTAVSKVLNNVKAMHPNSRVTAVFEFKSATSVRNVLFNAYSESFNTADEVVLWQRSPSKLPTEQRMDIPALARRIGAHAFSDQKNMRQHVLSQLYRRGEQGNAREDVLLLMSCADYGDFVAEIEQLTADKSLLSADIQP